MNSKFCGESYTIGFIECSFLACKYLTTEECKRYLESCKSVGQNPNEKILEYISKKN